MTTTGENPSWAGVVGRAAPRILCAVVGLVMIGVDDGGLGPVGLVGVFLFVSSLVSVVIRPTQWWHHVRTGRPLPPDDEFVESGDVAVMLVSPGPRPIEVIKALREVTVADFGEAKAATSTTPATVAVGLSHASALRVCERINRAGGTSVVTEREA